MGTRTIRRVRLPVTIHTAYDTSFLELHGAVYRVTYPVPKDLQLRLGKTRLKKSLRTGDLKKAAKLKRAVIGDFDKLIEAERRAIYLDERKIDQERFLASPIQKGIQYRKLLDDPDNDEEGRTSIRMDIDLEYGLFLGKPTGLWDDGTEKEEPVELYDEQKTADAQLFFRTVFPDIHEQRLDECHKAYIEGLTKEDKLAARTIADDERAYRHLKQWCWENGHSLDMTKFTSLMARTFMRDLHKYTGAITKVTKNKYAYRLKKFWIELDLHGLAGKNIWLNRIEKGLAKADDERERAFKMDEVRRLLMGNPREKLHDLIMIGLLTGARLEAIVRLKAGNVGHNFIIFEKMKKETGARKVPMHPDLKAIFERRTQNKRPEEDLFPDWPKPKKAGSQRERSFKASNAFTTYRQQEHVAVHDKLEGARRSRVNFHSCRRWFITHFRRNATLNLTRAVVGHSQSNLTDKVYAGGPLFDAAFELIKLVSLPPLTSTPIEDPEGINLYEYENIDQEDNEGDIEKGYEKGEIPARSVA